MGMLGQSPILMHDSDLNYQPEEICPDILSDRNRMFPFFSDASQGLAIIWKKTRCTKKEEKRVKRLDLLYR